MFDPTAFDNMKVVIEGALYDLDIIGELIITDRNDLMNIAKLSRCFDVSFTVPKSTVTAKIEIEANLNNLAAELLPSSLSEYQSGCKVRLQFFLEDVSRIEDFRAMDSILLKIWGETRKITQSVQMNPWDQKIKNVILVDFDRLITEEQMDDLVEMTQFMITSIQELDSFRSGK